jgi:hypothetical protein
MIFAAPYLTRLTNFNELKRKKIVLQPKGAMSREQLLRWKPILRGCREMRNHLVET